MFKSRETYYTENTKLKETKKNKTKNLSIESEKQNNWALRGAQRKKKIILKKRWQIHLNASSRN